MLIITDEERRRSNYLYFEANALSPAFVRMILQNKSKSCGLATSSMTDDIRVKQMNTIKARQLNWISMFLVGFLFLVELAGIQGHEGLRNDGVSHWAATWVRNIDVLDYSHLPS